MSYQGQNQVIPLFTSVAEKGNAVTGPIYVADDTANVYSLPILCADFKTIQMSMRAVNTAFSLKFLKSNDFEMPDFTALTGSENLYSDVMYVDESTGSNYNGASPRSIPMSATPVDFTVELQTNGARWVCALLTSSGDIGGEIDAVMTLISNFA